MTGIDAQAAHSSQADRKVLLKDLSRCNCWHLFDYGGVGGIRNSLLCGANAGLGNIEAPYDNLQGAVQMAGHNYAAGAVAYGAAGTPLVLTGTDFGAEGTWSSLHTRMVWLTQMCSRSWQCPQRGRFEHDISAGAVGVFRAW